MNLINSISNNYKSLEDSLSGWIDSTPANDIIDNFTYDLYESDNPFREFTNNKNTFYKTGAKVGAEVFSAFANPYYLTHKIINIPTYYQNAVDLYNSSVKINN